MKVSRNFTILSTIALSILAFAPAAGAVLVVNGLSGSFGSIGLNPADGDDFELTQGAISQPSVGASLVVFEIGVDLTGWTANGDAVIINHTVTIANLTNTTIAVFNVDSPTLTQILVNPIGVGYMTFDLIQNPGSDLATDTGERIVLPSRMQMLITYNGLAIETDGSDGTASLNAFAGASFSAIPEPATFVLLLGGLALAIKSR